MHSSPSYDTRKYDCCAPWFGEVGQEFTRRFRPEFEGALHSFVDSYASLYDHVVLLSDPGAPGVPHQPPGAAAAAVAARAASAQAYAIRQKKSFALIRKHIEDQAIRDDLDAPAIVGQGTLAWPIVIMAGTAQQTLLNLTDQDWKDSGDFAATIQREAEQEFKQYVIAARVSGQVGEWRE